jgi:nucleoside phosphorylase
MRTSHICRPAGLLLMLLAVLIIGTNIGFASSHNNGKITIADVIVESKETYKAFKNYTVGQRDEALRAAKKKLDTLDDRIDKLQQNLDQRWQEMSKTSREETRQTLKKLRRQRQNVAEWFGGMQHSSIEAWEDVKKGFGDSYDLLQKAFNDAKKAFDE